MCCPNRLDTIVSEYQQIFSRNTGNFTSEIANMASVRDNIVSFTYIESVIIFGSSNLSEKFANAQSNFLFAKPSFIDVICLYWKLVAQTMFIFQISIYAKLMCACVQTRLVFQLWLDAISVSNAIDIDELYYGNNQLKCISISDWVWSFSTEVIFFSFLCCLLLLLLWLCLPQFKLSNWSSNIFWIDRQITFGLVGTLILLVRTQSLSIHRYTQWFGGKWTRSQFDHHLLIRRVAYKVYCTMLHCNVIYIHFVWVNLVESVRIKRRATTKNVLMM